MRSLPWFRMWAEFATDPVVQSLAFDDQRHFVMLLCLKCSGVLDKEFGHPKIREDVIRKALGLDGVAFSEARTRLCGARLIDAEWHPSNWDKRQFLSDHSAAERMRKHRLRNRDVTVTPSDTDTDTDTEKRREDRETRVSRAPTAKRLPEDWELTEVRKKIAESEGIDASREYSKFRDHWLAASGANARKHDWDAAWRNWCRRAKDMVPRPVKSPERTWRPGPED